ncbi:MAG: ankyrin repeat domain-containing protein [Parachlamydiaceae bacterium]|nr:ankyrin repeat domain-containing protein [Parachlamydiaceae bacterium]
MIKLSSSHPASALWIYSYLNNKERVQVGLAHRDLYGLLQPFFSAFIYYTNCKNDLKSCKKSSLKALEGLYPGIYDDTEAYGRQFSATRRFSEMKEKLNYDIKIAVFWMNHNQFQITNVYNPMLISDFQDVSRQLKNQAQEKIEIDDILLKLRAGTVEAAIRISAAAKINQITMTSFELLCRYAKNINEPSKNRNTALHWAIKSKNENFACILLKKTEADCKIENSHGETPLHFAALLDTDNLVGTLMRKGAEINVYDRFGDTPLNWALRNKKTACIKLLNASG